eukprot:2562096-Amphidinium_carterae.1
MFVEGQDLTKQKQQCFDSQRLNISLNQVTTAEHEATASPVKAYSQATKVSNDRTPAILRNAL